MPTGWLDASILSQIQVLSEVANCSGATLARRRRYYDALRMIYCKLPFNYREKSTEESKDALCRHRTRRPYLG